MKIKMVEIEIYGNAGYGQLVKIVRHGSIDDSQVYLYAGRRRNILAAGYCCRYRVNRASLRTA